MLCTSYRNSLLNSIGLIKHNILLTDSDADGFEGAL